MTGLQETRMDQMDHHAVSEPTSDIPNWPQSKDVISFKSLLGRVLLKSSSLAKPEEVGHISELLAVGLKSE